MNILFISSGEGPDYQCDMLFYGLNELSFATVYSSSEMWYMFEGNDPAKISELYGKGFSLYNRLKNDRRKEDAPTIVEKIRSNFYDCIIYGSIHRCSDYLDEVLKNYPKQKIIFIDGEDFDFSLHHFLYFGGYLKPRNYILWEYFAPIRPYYARYKSAINLSQKGFYFKRELRNCDRKYFYPISFAIPEKNIITAPFPSKVREKALYVPGTLKNAGNPNAYKYDNEKDYYEGYATSIYAITTKKGGWDCLRHYEILANRCIPYFPQIEKCPDYTMHTFPKALIKETNKLIETGQLKESIAEHYTGILYDITMNVLTTKMLAKYVLSMIA